MAVAKKKPVQVYLDQKYLGILSLLVEKLRVSQAEVLRRGLESLAREVIPVDQDPAWQLIGLMGEDTDSPGDLSVEHDKYLAEWAANE